MAVPLCFLEQVVCIKRLLLFFSILSVSYAQTIVSDPALSKRLTEEKRYIIKNGDTWSKVASKVYGHSSWWVKLQKRNIDLSNFGEHQKLPRSSELWYRAPRVGRKYTVHKNDTFTRIVEWKYGGTKDWAKVIRLSSRKMRRYSKIEPGDQFEFLYPGKVVLTPKKMVGRSQKLRNDVKYEDKVYKSIEGDTLRIIAYRVFGHKSWWKKLITKNPRFRTVSPYNQITVGTKILYPAPVIGSSYRVAKGDTLSRIALWKYGNFKLWNKIAANNRELLSDPDLIHVGDRIVLRGLGNMSIVRKKSPGKVAAAPIVLKTPVVQKKVETIAPVEKKLPKKTVIQPKPVGPSSFQKFMSKFLKYLPIVIMILVGITVIVLLLKVSREMIAKQRAKADQNFLKNLSSQKPSRTGPPPVSFIGLKPLTDDGEYSTQIGYPEISRKAKGGHSDRERI